ncbi:MAG: hypothetical protein ACOZD0_14790, partial [Pseudomonadota bacterium]
MTNAVQGLVLIGQMHGDAVAATAGLVNAVNNLHDNIAVGEFLITGATILANNSPIIGAAANSAAIGLTVAKINDNGGASVGDLISLTGNGAAIAGAIATVAGAPVIATGLTIVGIGLALTGGVILLIEQNDAMADSVNSRTREAVSPPRRDPLALDLDNDGIETSGLPALGASIKFDHNGDGVKTGTGWLKPDDAWLVIDRNGNGSIDSGRELFGVDTQITVNGETRPATSGFEALSAMDRGTGIVGSAGYGDKIFDAKDADFTRVRLWQDLNQDGVSQTNELFTLTQKGVTSISLTPTTEATPLGNGNVITG